MLKKIKLILIISFFPIFSLDAKDNNSRLSLGGGIYNFMKHGSDGYNQSSKAYNVELFSGKKIGNVVNYLTILNGNIDKNAGINFLKKNGDFINRGDVILQIFSDSSKNIEISKEMRPQKKGNLK